jgi:predicted metal-binding protein
MDTGIERFAARARRSGAAGARAIDPRSVVTAEWVRWKCRYGCGGWNASLCCPPHSPTPQETRTLLDGYSRAILVHCRELGNVKPLVVALEREAFLAGHYRALALGSGPCSLCAECALGACAHPDEARPAMEACGIDVFATARANGFPIDVVANRRSIQNYYGLLLID